MKNTLLSLALSATFALAQGPIVLPPPPLLNVQQQITMISIGDSFASGEGMPNSVASNGAIVWSDIPCHRSIHNGRRIAADRVNQLDNVSTDFVDFSCAGATIAHGILGPMNSTEGGAEGTVIPPQLNSVVEWQREHNNRRIDVLLISVGAGDTGYLTAITACLFQANCGTAPFINDSLSSIANALPSHLVDLNNQIRQRLNVGKIYITPYPDAYRDKNTLPCPNFQDVVALGENIITVNLTNFESGLLENVLVHLNNELASFANSAGWKFVTGVQDTYRPHGFCNGGAQRWINTLGDSVARQGDKHGALHPNLPGQQAYADSIVAQMAVDFNLQPQAAVLTELYERTEGANVPNEVAVAGVTLRIKAEVAQTADGLTVLLQHRARNPLDLQVPPFTITSMTDEGAGSLNMFSATIPGVLPLQKIEYRVVVIGTRNGAIFNTFSNLQTITVGEPLLN